MWENERGNGHGSHFSHSVCVCVKAVDHRGLIEKQGEGRRKAEHRGTLKEKEGRNEGRVGGGMEEMGRASWRERV